MYGAKDSRILELFEMLFATGKISSSLVVGSKYMPAKCNIYAMPSSPKSYIATKPPDTFEVIIYIHALKLVVDYFQVERKRNKKVASPFRISYICGNHLGFAVQLILKAWESLAKKIGLESCESMLSPYVLFKESRGNFTVLAESDSGFAPKTQSDTFGETEMLP